MTFETKSYTIDDIVQALKCAHSYKGNKVIEYDSDNDVLHYYDQKGEKERIITKASKKVNFRDLMFLCPIDRKDSFDKFFDGDPLSDISVLFLFQQYEKLYEALKEFPNKGKYDLFRRNVIDEYNRLKDFVEARNLL